MITHEPHIITNYRNGATVWLFFFHGSSDPPALPSFPTRRSSDLVSRAASARFCPPSAARMQTNTASKSTGARSEEHTSELQSHVNLVCRLLLEKKKIQTRTASAFLP